MNKAFFYFGILFLIMSFSSWYFILFNMDFIYALNDPVAIVVVYYNAPVGMLGGISFLYGSFKERKTKLDIELDEFIKTHSINQIHELQQKYQNLLTHSMTTHSPYSDGSENYYCGMLNFLDATEKLLCSKYKGVTKHV